MICEEGEKKKTRTVKTQTKREIRKNFLTSLRTKVLGGLGKE